MYIHGNTEYYAQKKNDFPCYFVHKTNKHIKAMTETIKTPDHRPTPDTAYNRKGARNNQKKMIIVWSFTCGFLILGVVLFFCAFHFFPPECALHIALTPHAHDIILNQR